MRLFSRFAPFSVLSCISWLVFAMTLGAQTTAVGAADDKAIHQLVQNYLGAREQNDAKAVASLFTEDADQLVSSGEWRKGRDAIVKGTLASSRNTGGSRTVTIQNIRLLTPDVAIADGRYELTGLKEGAVRNMWSTFVVKRGNDGWRIAAIRNMLPAAPAPTR
jgi:uncharacterized protein (TIGR02246 family)